MQKKLRGNRSAGERRRFAVRRVSLTRQAFLFIIVTCLQVSVKGFAQYITFSGKDVPLRQVFSVIKEQTGYSVLYDYEVLAGTQPVSLSVKNIPLTDFLNKVLSGQQLGYTIKKKTVFIKKTRGVENQGAVSNAGKDPFLFLGIVRDVSGKALNGASVVNQKTREVAVSNSNGFFSLHASANDVIAISFVSYEKVEVRVLTNASAVVAAVGQQSSNAGSDNEKNGAALRAGQDLSPGLTGYIITLSSSSAILNEVIIYKGYYTEKQRYSVGSVSKITAKDIRNQPVSNVLSALQGIAPGVEVANTSGSPGSPVRIRLRGINTMNDANATVSALMLVDGVPVTDLSYISPADIESIEVLKDATATAIYGSRGAAGVILITTKKGHNEQHGQLAFQAYTGISQPVHTARMLNTDQYRMLRKEAFANDGIAITPANAPDLLLDSTVNTDWSKALYKNALSQDYQLNFSGGSSDVNYYLSGGYRNEDAIIAGDWYQKRFNFRMGVDAKVSDRLTVGGGVGYTNTNSNMYGDAIAATIYYAVPMMPAFKADGSPNTTAYVSPLLNPNRQLNAFTNTQSNQFLGNAYFNYRIYKQLYFRTDLSYQLVSGQSTNFTPTTGAPYSTVSLAAYPYGTYGYTNNNAFTIEPQFNYSLHLKKHLVKLLAGGTLINRTSRQTYLSMSGYSNNQLSTLASATLYNGKTYTEQPYKFASAFGRASYNYDGKYLVDGVFRRDGSSRFGANYHYGNFWAVGAGWIFSEASFLNKLSSNGFFGKIKASYGATGNDNIGDFSYLNYSSTSVYNDAAATYLNGLANPYLRWEQTNKMDIGLDLSFLSGRITFAADYFNHRTKGTLYSQALSLVTGFSAISANLDGVVRNRGFEFNLGGDVLRYKKFKWNSQFDISFLQNRLLALPGLSQLGVVSRYQFQVGQPLALNWGLRYLGIDPNTGLAQFLDADHSGTIGTYTPDMQVLGKAIPSYNGAWSNTFSWKRFDLYVLTQFVGGVQKPANTYTSGIGEQYNLPVSALDRWQHPGQATDVPRAAAPGTPAAINNDRINQSSFIYFDASYLRIKNITLSYTFPAVGNSALRNLRIYATAYNVFTMTDYPGNDPESGPTFVPVTRQYVAGVSFNL